MTTQDQFIQSIAVSPRWQRLVHIAWYLLSGLAVVIFIASIPGYIQYVNSIPHGEGLVGEVSTLMRITNLAGVLFSMTAGMVSVGLAWALFHSRSRERIALLLSFYLLVYGIAMTGVLEAFFAAFPQLNSELPMYIQTILLTTPTIALFALLPDGRFVPGWTRWLVLVSLPVMLLLVWQIASGLLDDPFSVPLTISMVIFLCLLGLTIYAQVYRYRKVASAVAKQQVKWVAFGLCIWIALIAISSGPYIYLINLPIGALPPWWVSLISSLWWLSQLILPLFLSVAVFRYRLYNIDLIINRTLVYGALTASTVLLYVLIVGSLGVIFQSQGNLLLSLFATGLVAMLFHPMRQRLQDRVDRLMYGDRVDPISVLTNLGKQLEYSISPAEALGGIVDTLALALKLPYAAIEFGMEDVAEVIASFGAQREQIVRFPIVHQKELVGNLVVAYRPGEDSFAEKERELLETIARQAGATAQAAKLTADLQQSRQRLVNAREEERRRIRRDLHDGLGPQLASQTLALDALEHRIVKDPAGAIAFLQKLKDQSRSAIHDIRQLVYDLRPPTLDELGLVGALREMVRPYQQDGLVIGIRTEGNLPSLPAAAEVAAYRITQEAITNVVRHAEASRCDLRLSLEKRSGQDHLRLEISDNGKGMPEKRSTGIGMHSMQERAEELGGRIEIRTNKEHGTRILVFLPLPQEIA